MNQSNAEDGGVLIRPAQASDAPGIAHVLVDTFLDAYAGIIQDSTLKKLSIPGRSVRWEQVIAAQGSDIVLVAVDSATMQVLGYAYGGSCRDVTMGDGEIYQLYVHPQAQHRRLGERLFTQFARRLWLEGYVSMVANVLEGSPSMSFYRYKGGVEVGGHAIMVDGKPYREITFRWPDLDEFMHE